MQPKQSLNQPNTHPPHPVDSGFIANAVFTPVDLSVIGVSSPVGSGGKATVGVEGKGCRPPGRCDPPVIGRFGMYRLI